MPAEEANCNVCTDFRTLRRKPVKAKKPTTLMNSTEFPCPLDGPELGRATWAFLHTMAAYYPETPSPQDRDMMRGFITGLARFYPCNDCAEHLRTEITRNPPLLGSNLELSQWFCEVHNEVNARLFKPLFDCRRVMERWRTGSSGSDCFPIE